jgi:hypothetical protein
MKSPQTQYIILIIQIYMPIQLHTPSYIMNKRKLNKQFPKDLSTIFNLMTRHVTYQILFC